jgi:putative endonuclease
MNEEASNQWVVYIIQTETGKLYTGITNNLKRRFNEHCTGNKGARFFHLSNPEKIVFQESHSDRSHASKREATIKKMSRKEKLSLIDKKALYDKNQTSNKR